MEQKTASTKERHWLPGLHYAKKKHKYSLSPSAFYWIVRDSRGIFPALSLMQHKTAESQLFSFPESFTSDFEAQEVLTKQQRTDSAVSEVT